MDLFKRRWKSVPHTVRKPVVLLVGGAFCIAAALTGWLPGPGGIPLFLIGIAILASEFAWAERLKHRIMGSLHRMFAWFKQHLIWGSLIVAIGLSLFATSIYWMYFR